jgi:hypothetical protein
MTKLKELDDAWKDAWVYRRDTAHAAEAAFHAASTARAAEGAAWAALQEEASRPKDGAYLAAARAAEGAAWAALQEEASRPKDGAYLAAAHDAYAAELRKQAKTPREPVEDEGNPLV